MPEPMNEERLNLIEDYLCLHQTLPDAPALRQVVMFERELVAEVRRLRGWLDRIDDMEAHGNGEMLMGEVWRKIAAALRGEQP